MFWRCLRGHRWDAPPAERSQKQQGCPYCSGRKVLVGFNDLKTRFPEIAAEADGWDPSTLVSGSREKCHGNVFRSSVGK